MKMFFTAFAPILLFLFTFQALHGQECEGAVEDAYLHANNVRALLNNSGSLFFDKGGNASYQVPFTSVDAPSSIFAAGLWLGGINPANELLVSAQTYGYSGSTPEIREYDYLPGPLDANGSLAENCENWDKVWSVDRIEIEQHQADFADNNTIDQPLAALYSWPGQGNPHFEAFNGFALPGQNQPFAPFFDQNTDGIYNPDDGDYPVVPQSVNLPQQITWSVFNDFGEGEFGIDISLGLEIQLTTWAFNCSDNPQLNNTIFTSYKIINRSNAPIDSLHIGIWNDYDIGCFNDDLIGSAPTLNTFFAYDIGQDEQPCEASIATYDGVPPVQATTILNTNLSYFMRIERPGSGGSNATSDPSTPAEYFNFLTGSWRDGTPLSFGGTGYDPTGVNPITSFVFPGDPSVPEDWSYLTSGLPETDIRGVGSINIGTFAPGQIQTIDIAYSTFLNASDDAFGNTEAMYSGIPELQAWYDSNFEAICAPPLACEEDCLWPGDTNADGIANHCDLLPIGLKYDSTGPARSNSLIWFPTNSNNWSDQQTDGANNKHIDANGDGAIDSSDFDITLINYGRTTPDYVAPADNYPSGTELFFTTVPPNNNFQELEAGDSFIGLLRIDTIPDLSGIALTVEYDTRYFESFESLIESYDPSIMRFSRRNDAAGEVDFVRIGRDDAPIPGGTLLPMRVRVQQAFPEPLPADTSLIRIKNIKAVRTDGSIIQLGAMPLVASFLGVPVSTSEPTLQEEKIQVFPNPTSNHLTIQVEEEHITALQLFSPTGQEVLSKNALSEQQIQLSINHLPKGLYLLRVRLTDRWAIRKVIVK